MFTTRSTSGNSNRWGVSASRSFGPISGSVLIIVNTWSMTSRNSFAELKLTPRTLSERVPPLHQVLVDLRLDHVAHVLGELEHERPIGGVRRGEARQVERLAELDPPAGGT